VTQGRFVGAVTINGIDHFGDALITSDGALRLYVGGPYADDGALELNRPTASQQFVGTYAAQATAATGSGILVGQLCSAVGASEDFCGKKTPANMQATFTAAQMPTINLLLVFMSTPLARIILERGGGHGMRCPPK
jgi:hypothetical protein